ncbi:hypothetical protein [Amycolatopsis sacchari]|uniref:hypothetical protein n=1 Tax=Amycolatopsis sacchari TaxID=115433 RepID=UPI003EBEB64A
MFPAATATAPAPFMVVGRVNGHEETACVAGPAEALARMLEWLRADEHAAAVWYLREDWPEVLTLVGRPVRGVVGEASRSAHLFRIRPGAALHGSVVACCGAELPLPDIEWLRPGAGMPCECCLVLGARTRPELEGYPV